MFTLSKLYPLNAKVIKASLKREGVKVYSCKKGTGTTKNATYIVIDIKDAEKCISFIANIGIVSCLNKPHRLMKITRTEGMYIVGACYMDAQTYKELNS